MISLHTLKEIGVFFCVIASAIGCEGVAPPIEDELPPQIQLLSPQQDTLFENQAQIVLDVIVSENDLLHEVLIEVRNRNTWEKYYEYYTHIHEEGFQFRDTFSFTVLESTPYLLRVSAEDHHYNANQIDYPFTIIP